ncbi:MAG: hypothetical protein IT440_06440 [Phycisphaeraceae bacterium]|nr:hypothetical protein [Phycisphaeraceae bacterium]
MSTPNSTFSQRVAVAAALDPQSVDNTNVTSDWANLSKFGRVAFVVNVGAIAATSTVDVALYEATSNAGAGAQALTGKAITQLVTAGANQQAVIEARADELSDGFTHVACRVTVGVSTAVVSAVGLGIDARAEPASDNDIASVVQIVAD